MKNSPSVFITGATGFIGAWLLRYLAQRGWSVTASGRGEAPAPLLAQAAYIRADVRQPLPGIQADAVIHAAALASDTASAADLWAVNVEGTRHVFESTRPCACFVYISSASVYDYRLKVHREDEEVDNQQLSAYGRSKRAAENWLMQQDWSCRTLIILRPRAVYGPGDRVLLPRLLRLVRGKRLLLPGTRPVQSSLTHVENLCAAVVAGLTFAVRQPGGVHVFNVADGQVYALQAVISELLPAVCGRPLTVQHLPLAPLLALAGLAEGLRLPGNFTRFGLAALSQNCALDVGKITATLDFQPTRVFAEALPEIADWAGRVGLADLRTAAVDLPWRI